MAGNITIIVPKENFVKVPKGVVYDETVDTLSLGIFVKVLCLGRKWQLNVPGLADILGLSVAKIKKAFKDLEGAGYLRRTRVKGPDGRFIGWDYEISSEPFTDHPKNRPSVNTDIGENRPSENGGDINREYKEDKDLNNKNKRKDHFVKPTVEEVAEYCRERQNGIDATAFVAFYESKGWMVGKSKMQDWRQAVITWEIRSRKDGRKATAKAKPLGDYYTDLIQEMKEFYGTDSPDEQ